MVDHVTYLNDKAEKIRTAGILTEQMIDFYHDLYTYQQQQYDRYVMDSSLPELQPSDLPLSQNGKKIFAAPEIGEVLIPGLAPLIQTITSRNPGLNLKFLQEALEKDAGNLNLVIEAVLDMDAERLNQFAIAHKTGADETIFVIINWLKPFFISLREKQVTSLPDTDESQLCPFCGSQPDMAAIVSGMDGNRYLHCSLCDNRWHYKRIACAVCGTEDAAKLEYLSSEDEPRYRIDVCESCKGYIKTVCLQKFEDIDECDLAVENILTPHLDSAAIKKGYNKP